uniref:Ubiquitin-ribosomal protein eL40 fusion protein n=1 Tax=Syphacia muris TaxID=451379 RepID=A0A0N5ABA2_9BILA
MTEQIFIRTLNDSTITVDVPYDLPIAELREIINSRENLASENYLISYKDTLLDDDKLFIDYGIAENSTLHLVSTLPGGGRRMNPNLVCIAAKYRWNKRVCRKCYARLPPKATRCRKKRCHSTDIREKAELKVHKP